MARRYEHGGVGQPRASLACGVSASGAPRCPNAGFGVAWGLRQRHRRRSDFGRLAAAAISSIDEFICCRDAPRIRHANILVRALRRASSASPARRGRRRRARKAHGLEWSTACTDSSPSTSRPRRVPRAARRASCPSPRLSARALGVRRSRPLSCADDAPPPWSRVRGLYDLLGVPRTPPTRSSRRYVSRRRQDVPPGRQSRHEPGRFGRVAEAAEVLSDPSKRRPSINASATNARAARRGDADASGAGNASAGHWTEFRERSRGGFGHGGGFAGGFDEGMATSTRARCGDASDWRETRETKGGGTNLVGAREGRGDAREHQVQGQCRASGEKRGGAWSRDERDGLDVLPLREAVHSSALGSRSGRLVPLGASTRRAPENLTLSSSLRRSQDRATTTLRRFWQTKRGVTWTDAAVAAACVGFVAAAGAGWAAGRRTPRRWTRARWTRRRRRRGSEKMWKREGRRNAWGCRLREQSQDHPGRTDGVGCLS